MPHPFVDHVGARIVEAKDGKSLLSLTVQPFHFNSHRVVHGAVMFALADTGMGAALYTTLAEAEMCTTIEIKINFLRPITQGEVECRSEVVHRGRTTAMIESTLHCSGKVAGKASGTFAVLARPSSSAA